MLSHLAVLVGVSAPTMPSRVPPVLIELDMRRNALHLRMPALETYIAEKERLCWMMAARWGH